MIGPNSRVLTQSGWALPPEEGSNKRCDNNPLHISPRYIIILDDKSAGIIIFLETSDCTEESRKNETCLQLKMKKHYIKTWKISREHISPRQDVHAWRERSTFNTPSDSTFECWTFNIDVGVPVWSPFLWSPASASHSPWTSTGKKVRGNHHYQLKPIEWSGVQELTFSEWIYASVILD